MAAAKSDAGAKAGDYVITAAAAQVIYEEGGAPSLVLGGRVVKLSAVEATRLSGLGAVQEATDEDHAREEQIQARERADLDAISGLSDNPYGGSIRGGGSLEEHAAAEKAKAAKK